MVDFILVSKDESVVEQFNSFELSFEFIDSIELLNDISGDSVVFIDMTNNDFNLTDVQNYVSSNLYFVAIVENFSKKDVKNLLDTYNFLFAHVCAPLIKADIALIIEDLTTFITQKASSNSTKSRSSQKLELKFDVLDNSTNEEEHNIEKLGHKLGNLNFFEDKSFDTQGVECARIQQRFNIVFNSVDTSSSLNGKVNDPLSLNSFQVDDDLNQEENMSAQNSKKGLDFNLPKLDFEEEKTKSKKEITQNHGDLDFNLEFGEESVDSSDIENEAQKVLSNSPVDDEKIDLDFQSDLDFEIENQSSNQDATSKTIVFDRKNLSSSSTDLSVKNDKSALDFSSIDDSDSLNDDLSLGGDSVSLAGSNDVPAVGIELGDDNSSDGFSLDGSDANGENIESSTDESSTEENGLNFSGEGLVLGDLDEEFVIENNGPSKKLNQSTSEHKNKTDSLDFSLEINNEESEVDSESKSLNSSPSNSSLSMGDYMTSAEARVNIENTIKDIIRPNQELLQDDKTGDIDLNTIDDGSLDFDAKTLVASPEYFKNAKEIEDEIGFESEFDYGKVQNLENKIEDHKVLKNEEADKLVFRNVEPEATEIKKTTSKKMTAEELIQQERKFIERSNEYSSERNETEDYVRAQSTIRQLREEIEEQLIELKQLRRENKDLEQENLSLRALTDEQKIEQSIIRKRHLSEVENLKYQLKMSEEKKLTAEERLKQSEKGREKLDQKLRLDFSQIRQREKELEGQLELLSLDHDTQIQTRDGKILELRRKIESLEFNMENASIREQKTNDDKKKLENKLVKIMNTLRNSIEDIDEDSYSSNFEVSDAHRDDE